MDLKKISGAAFFAVAVVACLALMSTHNQAEDIKFYGDDLTHIGSFVSEESDESGPADNSAADALFNDDFADQDDDSAVPPSSALSGLSALQANEGSDDDDEDDGSFGSAVAPADPLAEFESNVNSDSAAPESEDGGEVQDGDEVTVQYRLRLKDGTQVYNQWGDGDGGDFTFEAGGGHVIPGFDSAIQGMKVGQQMDDVEIPADQAYGSKGFSAPGMNIPPNSDLVYDLKVVKKN